MDFKNLIIRTKLFPSTTSEGVLVLPAVDYVLGMRATLALTVNLEGSLFKTVLWDGQYFSFEW